MPRRSDCSGHRGEVCKRLDRDEVTDRRLGNCTGGSVERRLGGGGCLEDIHHCHVYLLSELRDLVSFAHHVARTRNPADHLHGAARAGSLRATQTGHPAYPPSWLSPSARALRDSPPPTWFFGFRRMCDGE